MEDFAYQLTPRSGERLAAADDLAQQANLLGLVVGHRVRETSFGRNAALRLALSGLRRFARQEFGELAASGLPVAEGLKVRVPAFNLHLRGDTLTLRGPEGDGSQLFDLTGLPAGDYALLLESWVALVGATTLGQATQPAIYTGVTDTANKPDATHFYEAGNVNGKGLPDAVFADTTIQTTKALQRQYRLSLIPDRNLIGYQSDLVPAGTVYQVTRHPDLVQAAIPECTPGAWDRAIDRRFLACKLGVVSTTGSALTLHTADFRVADDFEHKGQRPAPLRLTREQLEAWLRSQVQALTVQVQAIESRLAVVEAQRQAALVRADTEQIVMPLRQDGSVLPQRLRFTQEVWDTQAWHDPVAYPTRIRLPFNGVVQVHATATFVADPAAGLRGLRLLQNNLPTAYAQVAPGDANLDTPLTLSAELTVSAGDYLEIEPWQASGATLTVREGATFSVRRIV
ncbi:hypothetical protein [Deinococcus sp. S9]|uniref:hypothetical protein n=1 Tax=Deinococcus sp. S9 TaxID=2545754 RepID=UPI0010563549|nr:hypothetical protein [Deinococcus sp. S9]TDE85591.1 hypothetical protein E0686_11305 [Deinococcus sp. S9]